MNSQLNYNSESNSQQDRVELLKMAPVNSQLNYNSESNSQLGNGTVVVATACE
ncbi:hypothetical protein K8089_10840 [Aequorivita sp. F47161]|uniref:Uncharacterized protein n=1 Tax=Aequorivita vitellina TaxID=2874475 RepID=A0A9X1QWC9_9FLAO|nr:hypothetical protein [Aequorivita vitellina]MCG2419520.1 hypothetical protein [Aequorivita vitellina]